MGKTYGNRLLDPFNVQNKPKWEGLYQKIVDDENKGEGMVKEITSLSFNGSSISKAFSEEKEKSNTSLNKVCKDHYEKKIENKTETDTTKIQIGDDDWKAFWMLCSMWNPITISKNQSDYPNNSIGKTNADELLSTQGNDNEALWKEKNDEFFRLSAAPTEGLFKQLYDENKDQEHSNKLKQKCEDVYKIIPSNEQNGNSVKAEDAIKYCSMKLIS